ncbi:MAG: MerR family transcriptional regulator [Solobacterium sp.]|nr:MerR family transcriptional regulator [Solobacterium sp.]
MLIHEISALTETTKKAVEYYCEKGLLKPTLSENGYRVFTEEDVSLLKKISTLRRLGISVEEIRDILNGNEAEAFSKALQKQNSAIEELREQNELLKELIVSGEWETVRNRTKALETRKAIMSRLTESFPGPYGKFLAMHFGRFLKEPLQSEEAKSAYREILEFLDNTQFEIPDDLEEFMDDLSGEPALDEVNEASGQALSTAVEDPENWLQANREIIEQYMQFIQSDEYRNSPAYRLREALKSFCEESGYYDVFIPAMRRLSPAYDAYLTKLHEADQSFMEKWSGK